MWRIALLLSGVLFLAGCTTSQQASQAAHVGSVVGAARILLIEPDIKFYVLTAGGVSEPQPDWTEAARRNFVSAAQTQLRAHGHSLVAMDPNVADETISQYEKLHESVAGTILQNYFGFAKLPSKQGVFDYSVGPGVSVLRDRYGADYALFVFYRDYRSSGGRMAFAFLAAAVGGIVGTGNQFGFASLVDLTSGDIVWCREVDIGTGDLRDQGGANQTASVLFEGMPGG